MRFLFMPNYKDYQCRVGDVGFVIQVQDLSRQLSGTWGVRGVAEKRVVVRSTWVAPNTRGLHFAQFQPLENHIQAVPAHVCRNLANSMIEQGWSHINTDHVTPCLFTHSALDSGLNGLVIGLNWQGQAFLMGRVGSGDRETFVKLLQQSWDAAMLPRQRSNSQGESLPSGCLQWLPSAQVDSPTLLNLCDQMVSCLNMDGKGTQELVGLADEMLDVCTWTELLSGARVCSVVGMATDFPTATVSLEPQSELAVQLVNECFGQLHGVAWSLDLKFVARVSNGANVDFFAPGEEIKVTRESFDAVMSLLISRLNAPRLFVVKRARRFGRGPLAELEYDVFRLICEFVTPAT